LKIQWIGHACFRIEASDGTVILTDPFDEDVPYKAPSGPADIVLVSHDHFDHNAVHRVEGDPEVVRGLGERTVKGIAIRGIPAFHDTEGGRKRGRDVIFKFKVDGVELVHFGDLGHSMSEEQRRPLHGVEVAFIPVGGHFTIGPKEAVEAAKALPNLKVILPMHYKTDLIKDWPIQPLEEFTRVCPFPIKEIGASELELSVDALPARKEVWVLDHA